MSIHKQKNARWVFYFQVAVFNHASLLQTTGVYFVLFIWIL